MSRRLSLRDLDAAAEALRFRSAGEVDPDETGGLDRDDYEAALEKVDEMAAARRRARPPRRRGDGT